MHVCTLVSCLSALFVTHSIRNLPVGFVSRRRVSIAVFSSSSSLSFPLSSDELKKKPLRDYLLDAQEQLGTDTIDLAVAVLALKDMQIDARMALDDKDIFLVESFFRMVLITFPDKRFLKEIADPTMRAAIVRIAKRENPMTKVNNVLLDPAVRAAVWQRLGLTCAFPCFPKDMLHGTVSMFIHNPRLERVFLSDGLPEVLMVFFTQLSQRVNQTVEIVSALEAAVGSEALLAEIRSHSR